MRGNGMRGSSDAVICVIVHKIAFCQVIAKKSTF